MNLLGKLARTEFVRSAVTDKADLSELKRRPTARTWTGIFFMGLSYIIGWPAIIALGFVAAHVQNPWLVAVGGPLLYGLSHLVFLLGAVLAGTQYTRPLLRWAARRAVERWGSGDLTETPVPVRDEKC